MGGFYGIPSFTNRLPTSLPGIGSTFAGGTGLGDTSFGGGMLSTIPGGSGSGGRPMATYDPGMNNPATNLAPLGGTTSTPPDYQGLLGQYTPPTPGGSLNIPGQNFTAPSLGVQPKTTTPPGYSLAPLGYNPNAPASTPPSTSGHNSTFATPINTGSTPTSTTPNAGLTDMGGKTWGALGTVIPQGWFMDQQGNFVFKGAQAQAPQTSGITTLQASYVSTAFNPSETAANLKAGGYTQQPDGTWTNITKPMQDWQSIYGGGAPGGTQQSVAPAAGVASPTAPSSNNSGNSTFDLLKFLRHATQPQYQTVKTPLGYTQYQSTVPQGNDALIKLLIQSLMGQSGTGGNQGAFWDLLSGNSGSNTNNAQVLPLSLALLGGG